MSEVDAANSETESTDDSLSSEASGEEKTLNKQRKQQGTKKKWQNIRNVTAFFPSRASQDEKNLKKQRKQQGTKKKWQKIRNVSAFSPTRRSQDEKNLNKERKQPGTKIKWQMIRDVSASLPARGSQDVSAQVKERWNTLKVLSGAEGFSIQHRPHWFLPTIQAATYVIDATGAPEMFPVGPNLRSVDEAVLAGIIEQFSSMSLEQIHHFALNGEFMYGLFREKRLVDLLIHVGDRVFYGHRSVLSTHSSFFASILLDNDVPPYKVTDVTLKFVDPELFRLFLHFAYTGDIFVTKRNLAALKHLANAIQSATLRARLLLYMSKTSLMTLPEALYILCNHMQVEEKPIAVEVVKLHFKEVLEDTESLGRFSLEDFQDIISSSDICVNSELDIFWAVLFWVATNPSYRVNYLNKLMNEVRFTNMTSLELMDCARVSDLIKLCKGCKNLLVTANWVCHARELGLEDPLGLPMQAKRQCFFNQAVHEPTVAEFDHRFITYTVLMQKNGQGFQLEDDRELKPAVSFESTEDARELVYRTESELTDQPQTVSDESVATEEQQTTATDSKKSKLQPEPEKKDEKALATTTADNKSAPGTFNPVSKMLSTMWKYFEKKTVGKETKDASSKETGKQTTTPETKPKNDKSNDTEKKAEEQQPNTERASFGNESLDTDASSNAPRYRLHQPSVQTPLDPLLLWESSVLPWRNDIFAGGPLLQPIRAHKITLTRAHVDTQGTVEQPKVVAGCDITPQVAAVSLHKTESGVVNDDRESTGFSTHSTRPASSESQNVRGISGSSVLEQQYHHPESIQGAKQGFSKPSRELVQSPQSVEPSLDLMTFD